MQTATVSELTTMLENNQYSALREIINEMPPIDVSDFLDSIDTSKTLLVFRLLSKENALHVFSELDNETQQQIIASISDREIKAIIDDLWVDDAVDMLEEMPATLVKKVLLNSSPEIRSVINQYLHYDEDSVGSIMTAEFWDIKRNITVGQAIEQFKKVSHVTETIYTCFITDETRILQGVLPLKDILLAKDDCLIESLLTPDFVVAQTTMDKQEAARILMKYDLISLPVVDNEYRLVGIVTIDDAVDVLIEEDTESIEKMAAMKPSEKPYMKTSVLSLAINRLPWLVVSLITNIIVSIVLQSYSPIYVAMPILVGFIPMLMGTGGNAGSQTSTTIIRGMAVGEMNFSDFRRIIFKEFRISFFIGFVLGIICFVRIYITSSHNILLALMVSFSLLCAITVGNVTGAILPMLAKKVGLDPALMASPLVTTVVDILAIVIYFNIAMLIF